MAETTAAEPRSKSSSEAPAISPFQVTIERIVGAVENREESERAAIFDSTAAQKHDNHNKTNAVKGVAWGGPLTCPELSRLTMLCVESSSLVSETRSSAIPGKQSSLEAVGLGAVDGSLLTALVALLDKHVVSAASVNLIQEAYEAMVQSVSGEKQLTGDQSVRTPMDEWLKGTPIGSGSASSVGHGIQRLQVVRNGLDAACVLMAIMTSPGIDRRVVSEDSIDACIALLRQHLSKNLIPAIGNTGHLSITRKEGPSKPSAPSPTKKPRKSPSASKGDSKEQRLVSDLKQVYKLILSTSVQLLTLLERTDYLVHEIALDDRPVLTMCGAALAVFPVDPASTHKEMSICRQLHVSSITLITSIFTKYPQHRAIIVEDLFPIMRKLPSSKRSLRTYSLRNDTDAVSVKRTLFSGSSGVEGNHCIQAMTALIVSLVQCCVEMPTVDLGSTSMDHANDTTVATQQSSRLRPGLASCQWVCTSFVSQLLERCSKKGEEGGASEFRPILTNLLDDLLFLQLLPDHPAAEMMLFLLFQMMSKDVLKACSTGKSSSSSTVESTYLATAFDAMGKISASVARLMATEREEPFTISRFQPDAPLQDGPPTDANRCPCGRKTLIDTFMVNCDECHSWFHGDCVGLNKDNVSKVWVCNVCTLRRIVEEETRLFASQSRQAKGKAETFVSDTHVFRQLVSNYLFNQSKSTNSSSVDCARKMQLSKWIKELDDAHHADKKGASDDSSASSFAPKLLRDHFLSQWDHPSMESLPNSTSAPSLNRPGNLRATLTLLTTTSDLARSFGRQLGLFVQLMETESHVSLRKLAVKAISQVVEMDPTLMLQPSVTKAVSQRFRDDAKSVREAAVSLVGSFVLQTPEVANAFHTSLLPCLTDAGVSVKKRAVRIFRDILQSNPFYKGRASACAVMLRQAADPKEDDSVRDLVYELFTEMWLVGGRSGSDTLPKKYPQSRIDFSKRNGEASVVTPLSAGMTSKTECQLAVVQMVEVTMSAGTKDVVTSLMRELMSGLTDADKDLKTSEREQQQDALHKHSSDLVDALIEELLCLEESRSSEPNTFGPRLVATIRTIGVFAQVSPAEVLRHGRILLPYLKADNGVSPDQESVIVGECCDIITEMIPVMSVQQVAGLASSKLREDLRKITYRFGNNAIAPALRLLCALVNHQATGKDTPAGKTLLSLVKTFYGYLSKNGELSSRDTKSRSNVKRALSVLGSFCRSYGDSGEPRQDDEDEVLCVSLEDLSWSNVSRACLSVFLELLHMPDVTTKCAALRALAEIFMARPRVLLMLEQDGTIEDLMSQHSPVALQLESLRCWKDILLAEEKRLDTGDAKTKMETDETVSLNHHISGDQDGDATLIGGVLTQHADRLFELMTSMDDRVRLATTDLLGQLLRQGLLNPIETVPHLFALQGDIQQPQIRSLSLKLLVAEGEKRPDMIRQRVCAGMKQAYVFQRSIHSNKVNPTAVVRRVNKKSAAVESIFAGVFVECIRNSKKQRHGLYLNLLSLFEIEDHTHHSSSAGKERAPLDLSFLSFAAEVLAHLPYNTAEDPLFLIHRISSVAALQGAQLADRLAEFLRPYGLSTTSEHDDHIVEEDALELAARAKSPSRKKGIQVVNSSGFDITRFSRLCSDASAVTLLLRLKQFLRDGYNLSETRCVEYSPDARERSYDKAISTLTTMPMFDSNFHGLQVTKKTSSSRNNFEKDGLILQYAEFRKLMRSEIHADMKMSDSEDESNPRKRKNSTSEVASS